MSDYAFTHQGKAFTPNQTKVMVEKVTAHNEAVASRELARWQTKPERFVCYYTFPQPWDKADKRGNFYPTLVNAKVQLWGGAVVGQITGAHVYRHNFGGRIVSLRVLGTNGASYYGRASWDNGDVVILRKVK